MCYHNERVEYELGEERRKLELELASSSGDKRNKIFDKLEDLNAREIRWKVHGINPFKN